jgi:hypothetical protein
MRQGKYIVMDGQYVHSSDLKTQSVCQVILAAIAVAIVFVVLYNIV